MGPSDPAGAPGGVPDRAFGGPAYGPRPFGRVVVGVAPHGSAEGALLLAGRLTAIGSQVILVGVLTGPADRAAEIEAGARLALLRAGAADGPLAHAAAILVEVTVAASAAAGLTAVAAERQADLVVLGASERSAAGRLLAGDDVRSVLREADCAVAIATRAPLPDTRVIGVGWDGDEGAPAVLDSARRLATDIGAELAAIQVLPRARWAGDPTDAWLRGPDGDRRRLARELRERSGAAARVIEGVPAKELAAFGDEVDLLVIGEHRRGAFARAVLGATAERVVRHLGCPLVVVPVPAPARPRADARAAP